MKKQVPLNELKERLRRFRQMMDNTNPEWEMCLIISKINLYYFTGTMQEGMLIISREEEAVYWVRRDIGRALDESLFPSIKPMDSFKDARSYYTGLPATIYLEADNIPLSYYERFNKYFCFTRFKSLDTQIAFTRAVKSEYELSLMKKSGEIHSRVLEEKVPAMLYEGMSEAELASKIYSTLIEEGHHGISRFGMFDTEIILGHVGFGESSIYPTNFNGPGGNYGMSPAVPTFGSRERRLSSGDLVFIDVGCGFEGYHTDKTMTYVFGGSLPEEAVKMHKKCVDIQNSIAQMLRPGEVPSNIYNNVINSLDENFLKNFMGFGQRKVKFLGHGIGLTIDEFPVIAQGFDMPIEKGMVFALEPKKGIDQVGMVGIENTFIVTESGGECITGMNPGLLKV
ncbi:MAG TPA: Xaa-Pro peptidase family protein [Clostridia bacterium]